MITITQTEADGSRLTRPLSDVLGADAAPRPEPAPRRNDPTPDLELVRLRIADLAPAPRRTRKASRRRVAAVKRAMARFGCRVPILVDGARRVVDGHLRLEAARELGAETIPCIVVDDLPETEIRRLALSLNRLQETGEWDEEALRLEIAELVEIDGDLDFPGFEAPEIDAFVFAAGDGETPDPADDLAPFAAPEGDAVSRLGDVWTLGEHRILCSSARDGAALAAALDGETVHAVFTDPPYNVPINGHVRSAEGGFAEFAEASGEMSRAEFTAFLAETLDGATAALIPGGVLFACMDWRHLREAADAVEALGLEIVNLCVWAKDRPGMGSLYRSRHELVIVARRPGGSARNNVELGRHGRNRTNVWTYAGATGGRTDPDDAFAAHPTVKPIRMVMDALLDVTAPGERVLDPFLGSGTTLLAAERTRRRCLGVEIEPGYVDLAIRRWQAMTGGAAVLARTGETFDRLAGAAGTDAGRPGSEHAGEDF